ncbi:F-box domain-containing protein [Abeliophyllum distichum]|uniref:F-box domain-containing protein n=1 Tax=Abeliophyllum distichum TaxID=126358 RepID=A0ABD1TYI9_9LAMI
MERENAEEELKVINNPIAGEAELISVSSLEIRIHFGNDAFAELPSGDLRLEKGTMIKWVARFGKTLKNCVILGFRNSGTGLEGMVGFNNNGGVGGGLIMGFGPPIVLDLSPPIVIKHRT